MKTRINHSICLALGVLLGSTVASAQVTKPAVPVPSAPNTVVTTASVGQTITLNSVAYKVNAKKQLAAGVEYYTMVPTTNLKGKTVNYLFSNNVYNPTVFSQAQYEAFFSTGKLSSFGTLKKVTRNKKVVNYTTKGTSTLLMVVDGKDVDLGEFAGWVMAADDNEPTGGGSDLDVCKGICFADAIIGCKQEGQSDEACKQLYNDCLRDVCDIRTPKMPARHRITLSKPVLAL